MMTFLTSLRLAEEFRIDIFKKVLTVTKSASEIIGTSAKLIAGDKLKIIDLYYGLMLPSGNDSGHLLAEFFGK